MDTELDNCTFWGLNFPSLTLFPTPLFYFPEYSPMVVGNSELLTTIIAPFDFATGSKVTNNIYSNPDSCVL